MSIEIARYQFHSWSRKGISTQINDADDLGSGTSAKLERAEVPVGVSLNGAGMSKNFLLIGPGDIIGVNSNMIVRTDPLNWITDFEPNYLAFLEFYDEDFTWRYSPAAPVGEKLRPWIFLLVLKEDEFTRTKAQIPLPAITITSKDVFPPVTETWLWAHMHSNADIPDSELTDYEKFLLSLNQTVSADPDQVFSRLMSPRKLEANTAYHAFLIPAFETGRLAGLTLDTSATHAQTPSWDTNGAKGDMPVYFEWYFRTGVDEDFESLVKLLKPRTMDPSVGIRDMDASQPGFVEADDSTKEIPGTHPSIIGLEGALESPFTVPTVFPDTSVSNDFGIELQKVANLGATIIGTTTSGDPIISVPIYGSNHAKTSADDVVLLDIAKSDWVDDLNRDPRTRVAAGMGTTVVQKNQSAFLRKAWSQVTQVVAANKLIKLTVATMKVALQITQKTVSNFDSAYLLAFAKPVLSRVMGSPTTVYQQIKVSNLPHAVFTGSFRRLVRPRGKLNSKLSADTIFNYHTLVTALNNGSISAAPPRDTQAGLPNTQDIANQISPPNPAPSPLAPLIPAKNRIILLIVILIILLVLMFITGAFLLFGLLILAAIGGYFKVSNTVNTLAATLTDNQTAAANLSDPAKQLSSLPGIPQQPGFSLKLNTEPQPPPPTPTTPGLDSVEAGNFRTGLVDFDTRVAFQVSVTAVQPFNLEVASQKVAVAIHPHTSFPKRLSAQLKFPSYIIFTEADKIWPAMAYPDFEEPMYKSLCGISNEFMLPNLKLVPPNTISLLKTNQKFIESYMVGLNHEMGRELLWAEYPTDERGSYFRQFWDVKGIIKPNPGLTPAQLTEAYKDIKPIDTWGRHTILSSHNNRVPVGDDSPQAVLVIRGDLLKRYPNTLIFAQKAIAGKDAADPEIDLSLTDVTFETEVKFPLYKAEISPDIKFFGFDLTIEQAKGTQTSPGFTDSLGWFFVIQEIPGEPRFGMDVSYSPDSGAITWNDLSWDKFTDAATMVNIKATDHPTIPIPAVEAAAHPWGADSANMAYILFKEPSMVAVHASQMLESLAMH